METLPHRIGKYKIAQELLTTGFSDLFIGTDPDLDSTVAIKVFHAKGDNVGEKAMYGERFWRARFVEEARTLARFDHPNIISVMNMGETDTGTPYFVMPFMDANLVYEIGEDAFKPEDQATLDKKWHPRPISPRRAADIWRQLLDALAHMHAAGVVHRDIKPPNILLTSKIGGRVKLCDFGMVKVPGAAGSKSGIWLGTLDYISPEQRRSAKEVGPASDVYSAGVLMYRMLRGRLRPEGEPPLRGGRFDIPQSLADLIDACLRAEAGQRPADAREVLAWFDAVMPDLSVLPEKSKVPLRIVAARIAKSGLS